MAYPTLATADDYLVAMLKETDSGGQFGTDQRYRAIYCVANAIQAATHWYTTEATTVSLTNGTTSYALQTLLSDEALSWDRVKRIWISGYDALTVYTSEDAVRDNIANNVTGRPLGYYPLQPCTMLIDRDPDTTYTATVRRAPEIAVDFAEGSPGDIDIPLPEFWVYRGLDLGAWHFMSRTRNEYGYGIPTGTRFDDYVGSLVNNAAVPPLCRGYDPYGVE